MTPADLEALVGGYHGDPFAHLGPHPEEDGTWIIRAFLPQARRVSALIGDSTVELARTHAEGFFEGHTPARPHRYQFRIETQQNTVEVIEDPYRFGPLLSAYDLFLHGEGTNHEAWHALGSHLVEVDGIVGTRFTVWAPNAEMVSVAGDFNQWDTRRHPMRKRDGGVWEIFLPAIGVGALYKYFVRSAIFGVHGLKCDPYAFAAEKPPKRPPSSGTSRAIRGTTTPGSTAAPTPTRSSRRCRATNSTWKVGATTPTAIRSPIANSPPS